MKGKRKTAAALALLLFVLALGSLPLAARAEEPALAGNRQVVLRADQSDLANFIDGGRAAFDLTLRSGAPEWLGYGLAADGRDVVLTLEFDFSSEEEYRSRLAELLGYAPSMLCESGGGLLWIEGNAAQDLLNFQKGILSAAADGLPEKQYAELFAVEENTVTVDGEEYRTQEERLCICPVGEEAVLLQMLSVETVLGEDGTCQRTLTVRAEEENSRASDTLKERFAAVGTPIVTEITDTLTEVAVEFAAGSAQELAEQTMRCLRVPCSAAEELFYVDDRTVGVRRTEFADTDVLVPETGESRWLITCPSSYESVSSADEGVQAADGQVQASGRPSVSFTYERPFQFSSVSVETDLTSPWGEISRTITMTVPSELAVYYHDSIRGQFEERLIRGTTLNIYDQSGVRHYEFVYSAWSVREVERFTAAVLNGSDDITLDKSWLPYGKSRLTEELEAGTLLRGAGPAGNIALSYRFPGSASVADGGEASAAGPEAAVVIGSAGVAEITYRQVAGVRLAAEVLIVLIAAPIAILACYRLFNRRKKR